MARGSDPGRDFDRQFDQSQRRAEPKKQAGQGPWNMDKRLADNNNRAPSAGSDSCLVSAVALLGGVAWVVDQVVRGL